MSDKYYKKIIDTPFRIWEHAKSYPLVAELLEQEAKEAKTRNARNAQTSTC